MSERAALGRIQNTPKQLLEAKLPNTDQLRVVFRRVNVRTQVADPVLH